MLSSNASGTSSRRHVLARRWRREERASSVASSRIQLAASTAFAACLALATIPSDAAAESTPGLSVSGLLGRFAALPGVEARFREEKQIALLDAPLISEGRLSFVGGDTPRLLRRTESPSASTVLIGGDRLTFHDGRRRRELDLNGPSGALLRNFVQSFLYLLAGDEAALRRLYDITLTPRSEDAPQGWLMILVPRDEAMRRVLNEVRLSGRGVLLEQMQVLEASGDRTTTVFSDVDTDRRFTPEERARVFRLP
jgi:hypothetical protein